MRAKIIRGRGRPAIDSEEVRSRLPRDILDGLDAFSDEQDDKPARSESVRRILRDWLVGHGYLDK